MEDKRGSRINRHKRTDPYYDAKQVVQTSTGTHTMGDRITNDQLKRAERDVKNTMTKASNAINQAAKGVKRGTGGYINPTASGSGRKGGAMDREWRNHKWVSRHRNQDNKWMYDYGGNVSGGNNQKPTKSGNAKGNLAIAQDKAKDRNTGRKLSAWDRAVQTGRSFIDDLLNN